MAFRIYIGKESWMTHILQQLVEKEAVCTSMESVYGFVSPVSGEFAIIAIE